MGYWSTIEVYASVICACLPALPSLLQRKSEGATTRNSPTYNESFKTPKNRNSDDLPLLKVS